MPMTKSVDEPPVLSTARNAKEMLSRWRRPVMTAVESLDFCIDALRQGGAGGGRLV